MLCLFATNSYVKADELTYKMTVNNGNVSITEDSLISSEDYSDMLVNVIKTKNGQQSTIYSGKLGGYENGLYSKTDFSEINFMIIFDWDSMEDEAIYIIPATNQSTNPILSEISQKNTEYESTISLNSSFSASTLKTNMSLMYNDKYYENVLLPGQTLDIPISISNSGNDKLELTPYIARYDLSGKLIDVKQCEQIDALPNKTTKTTISKEFDDNTSYTAKIFLWQKNTMVPITDSIHLTIQNQDYYADNYEQANAVDVTKNICGIINTNNDVDIVKFTPSVTGIYALKLDASTGTVCGLYDVNKNLLSSVSSVANKNYLLYSLTKNQDYYIRFTGTENNSYEINTTIYPDAKTLIKNKGEENEILADDKCDIYKFIPQTSGEYIITAVNNSDVNAQLFNSSFEKISDANNTDSTVSFRIISSMTANQTYYIGVYPKGETTAGSYTIYVEEPFSVISVQ